MRVERTRLEGEATAQRAVGTGEISELPCSLALVSIGYRSLPISSDVPFDEDRSVLRQSQGRVVNEEGNAVPGLYCAGWCKRGPTGIVGTNIPDAKETVASIMKDAEAGALPSIASTDGSSAIPKLREILLHFLLVSS